MAMTKKHEKFVLEKVDLIFNEKLFRHLQLFIQTCSENPKDQCLKELMKTILENMQFVFLLFSKTFFLNFTNVVPLFIKTNVFLKKNLMINYKIKCLIMFFQNIKLSTRTLQKEKLSFPNQ